MVAIKSHFLIEPLYDHTDLLIQLHRHDWKKKHKRKVHNHALTYWGPRWCLCLRVEPKILAFHSAWTPLGAGRSSLSWNSLACHSACHKTYMWWYAVALCIVKD